MATQTLSFGQLIKKSAKASLYIRCGEVFVKTSKVNLKKTEMWIRKYGYMGIYNAELNDANTEIILITSINKTDL